MTSGEWLGCWPAFHVQAVALQGGVLFTPDTEPEHTRCCGHRVHAQREAQRLTPGRAREVRRG